MIICLCFGINHNALEQLKEQGCSTVREVQSKCQAGSSCGACIPHLKKSLQESPLTINQDSECSC